MKTIGYIAVTVGIMTYTAILNGYVLMKLWSWFIAPTFKLPLLTIPLAIGIGYTVTHLTHKSPKKDDSKSWGHVLFESFLWVSLKSATALTIGWLVSLFI